MRKPDLWCATLLALYFHRFDIIPKKSYRRKRRTRRETKQTKIKREQKLLKSFTDLLSSSTLNFSQEEIDSVLDPILKLRPLQRKSLFNQFLSNYIEPIEVTKEKEICQSFNLAPSYSNLNPKKKLIERYYTSLQHKKSLKNRIDSERNWYYRFYFKSRIKIIF